MGQSLTVVFRRNVGVSINGQLYTAPEPEAGLESGTMPGNAWTFRVPGWARSVVTSGCDGGAGGAGGFAGGTSAGRGGGGAAGTSWLDWPVPVVPGELLSVSVGAGGGFGTPGNPGAAGGVTELAGALGNVGSLALRADPGQAPTLADTDGVAASLQTASGNGLTALRDNSFVLFQNGELRASYGNLASVRFAETGHPARLFLACTGSGAATPGTVYGGGSQQVIPGVIALRSWGGASRIHGGVSLFCKVRAGDTLLSAAALTTAEHGYGLGGAGGARNGAGQAGTDGILIATFYP